MYGLPKQTRESFRKTIDTLVQFEPDRTCLLMLDYNPKIKKHQALMDRDQFPDDRERMICFLEATQKLIESGYDRIGWEHFAKPDDDLAVAFRERKIHWNTLGYTPGRYTNMIGIGSNSSSKIADHSYWQNVYSISEYKKCIQSNQFPIYRGHRMTRQDVIRRDVIQRLRSYFEIETDEIESRYQVKFDHYFQQEVEALRNLVQDGLVYRDNGKIGITDDGQLILATICNKFDHYFRHDPKK
jgi:oxygen-independent coproporphyrinogen-3 oxidase